MASHPSWIFYIEILLPDSTGAFQFGERLPETILGTQHLARYVLAFSTGMVCQAEQSAAEMALESIKQDGC
jgi:hypothetical protein